MIYCGLYLYFYYQDMIPHSYGVSLPVRIFDYLIFGMIPLNWLRVIGQLEDPTENPGERNRKKVFLWAWALGIAQILVGVLGTCFMNDYYQFASMQAGIRFALIGSVLTLMIVIVTGYYTLRLLRTSVSSLKRRYAGIVSTILCLWLCCQQAVDSGLYTGRFLSAWAEGIPDSTAPAVFLMGLVTFIFVFRADFSPLFYADGIHAPVRVSEQAVAAPLTDMSDPAGDPAPSFDLLELAAAQHGLTVRELDVLRLVYEGKNNPEIAEALFISRNTVKKHLQNIYEKTDVNSRMELIYIVNLKQQDH